jgi:STE24 endopeptidase
MKPHSSAASNARRITLVLLGCSLGFLVETAFCGATADAGAPSRAAPAGVGGIPSPDDSAPVPVPEPSEKAVRFHRSGNALWCVRTAWELFVPTLILFSGFSARLRGWAERIGRKWLFAVVIYVGVFMLVKYVLEFPLNCYQGFFRQHAYDLSNQSFGRWFSRSLLSLSVDLAGAAMFLWIPYLLMRKSPRRWWFYAWIAATTVALLVVIVTPIWIDPLFNQYGPMKDKALEADLLALANRAGIEGSRVYQVDKSADTKAINAYVTGLLGTKRIVLWDTLIARLDRRELLTVTGHEIGHYVLGHVWQGILLAAALSFLGLYAVCRWSERVIGRFKQRFGFDRVSDIASLPLLLIFVGLGNLALDPFILAYSRHVEHEADRFALEITRDNHAAATAEVKLGSANLSVARPGWLYKLWRASHPPTGERIDFANSYRPWTKGEALKYENLFNATDTKRATAEQDEQ